MADKKIKKQVKKQEDLDKYISDFRSQLVVKMPFYGEILSHLEIAESREFEKAATNGSVIYYNPDFFRSISIPQRNFVMMHELMHVILFHFKRDKGRDRTIWNIASDFVANGILEALSNKGSSDYRDYGIEFEKYENILCLEPYEGQSTEELYNFIRADNTDSFFKKAKVLLATRYHDYYKSELNPKRIRKSDLDLASNMSEEEISETEKKINDLVNKALKTWSKDPSSRLIQRELRVLKNCRRLPWQKLLKRFLSEIEDEEVSYARPERKYIHMDLILPGVSDVSITHKIDEVWAFIDTSGSIDADEMNQFISQLDEICRRFDAKLNVGYWDTMMHEVYYGVDKHNLLYCGTQHNGGTDVTAVYDFLDQNKIKPKVMLILTDGWFEQIPTSQLAKYKDKTIMVLSDSACTWHSRFGKVAEL